MDRSAARAPERRVSDVKVESPERAVPLEHAYVRILRKFLGRGETQ